MPVARCHNCSRHIGAASTTEATLLLYYAASDIQCVTVLGLHDLNAACDCVDHAILVNVFEIDDTVLRLVVWIITIVVLKVKENLNT